MTTVQLQCDFGHFAEDYPITTISDRKQKIFKSFCKRANKIQDSTIQPLKTLKPFELIWPLREQGTFLEFRNILGPFGKKIENLLFSEIIVIGWSSCKFPGSSSRTVKVLHNLMNWKPAVSDQ